MKCVWQLLYSTASWSASDQLWIGELRLQLSFWRAQVYLINVHNPCDLQYKLTYTQEVLVYWTRSLCKCRVLTVHKFMKSYAWSVKAFFCSDAAQKRIYVSYFTRARRTRIEQNCWLCSDVCGASWVMSGKRNNLQRPNVKLHTEKSHVACTEVPWWRNCKVSSQGALLCYYGQAQSLTRVNKLQHIQNSLGHGTACVVTCAR